MEIIVKDNRELVVKNEANTQNENNVETIKLTVPEKYNDFVKKIVFIIGENVISRTFENNQYIMERDILQNESVCFYIWLTKDNQDFRSKIKPLEINPNKSVNGEVTPAEQTEMERVISVLESEITKVDNIDIDANKEGNTTTITLTDKEGNEKTVTILDGQDGQDGQAGVDGVSPTLSETQTSDGYDVTITDVNGSRTISLINGKDGQDGKDGENRKRW